jgi:hypothetical protein
MMAHGDANVVKDEVAGVAISPTVTIITAKDEGAVF